MKSRLARLSSFWYFPKWFPEISDNPAE